FQAAQTQRQKNTLISAWTKSVRNGSVKTLLQVNVVDFGSSRGKTLSDPQLSAHADRYLREFLGGIERRRAGFAASPVNHIRLAGLPAGRATWNGSIGALNVVGVMYSVIVRTRYAVILHTQDLGNAPTAGMFEAMRSIELLSLAGEPDRTGPADGSDKAA